MKYTKNILLLALLGIAATIGIKRYTAPPPVIKQGDLLTAEQADAQLRAKGISPTEYSAKQLEAAAAGDVELLSLLSAAQPGRIVLAEHDNTALHLGAQNGHAPVCDLLASQHHITNKINAAGQTPLHLAAKGGHTECVDILLKRGAEPNKSDLHENSPLLYAVEGGHVACVELLLAAGASMQARTADGKTVSEVASRHPELQHLIGGHADASELKEQEEKKQAQQSSMLPTDILYSDEQISAAIEQGNTEQLADLLDSGLSPDYRIGAKLPLIVKATQLQKIDLVRLLLETGAAPNTKANNGDMALHSAAALGDDEIIILLLEHGADLHSQAYGTDALTKAIKGKHLSSTQLLIRKGADVNTHSANGETPLMAAVSTGQTDMASILIEAGAKADTELNGKTALQAAILNSHADCMQLLIEHGANPTLIPVNKRTNLHLAAEVGAADCAEILINAGADLNLSDANRETPLHIAARLGHLSTVEKLIGHGADLNTRSGNNQTPLHLAAAFGQAECITTLCKAGANLEITTADGYTPLHMAAKAGRQACVLTLLELGAKVSAESYHEETPLDLAVLSNRQDCVEAIALHILKSQGIEEINESALLTAIAEGNQPHVELLLQAKCSVTDQTVIAAAGKGTQAILSSLLAAGGRVKPDASIGTTPLHAAAEAGNAACMRLLIKHQAPTDTKDASGQTAEQLAESLGHKECAAILSDMRALEEKNITYRSFGQCLAEAAAKGDHLTVRRLLNVGVDLEYRDEKGNTALHSAATAKTVTCTRLLMEAGANANILNNANESPLMVATKHGRSSNVRALLTGGANPIFVGGEDIAATVAIKHNRLECLQHLLDGGTSIFANDGKNRPIIYTAIVQENLEAINILLARGADINVTVTDTPLLFITIRSGSPEILKMLLDTGKVDLNVTNEQGESAIHIAAQTGIVPSVALLLQVGMPIILTDKEGQTVLHHAVRFNRTELVSQLLSIGMNLNGPDKRGRTPLDIARQLGHAECEAILSAKPEAPPPPPGNEALQSP